MRYEEDRASGVTYFGPGAFVIAFGAVCMLFLGIVVGLNHLTDSVAANAVAADPVLADIRPPDPAALHVPALASQEAEIAGAQPAQRGSAAPTPHPPPRAVASPMERAAQRARVTVRHSTLQVTVAPAESRATRQHVVVSTQPRIANAEATTAQSKLPRAELPAHPALQHPALQHPAIQQPRLNEARSDDAPVTSKAAGRRNVPLRPVSPALSFSATPRAQPLHHKPVSHDRFAQTQQEPARREPSATGQLLVPFKNAAEVTATNTLGPKTSTTNTLLIAPNTRSTSSPAALPDPAH